jgi:membrane protein YqaA with SNARE-associated domain
MPLGKDLLMVALTARHHGRMLYYAGMATAGSVVGTLLLDVIFRKAGEKGLTRHVKPRRLEYIKRKVSGKTAWALVVACLAPPPFPFTPFIMAASALQYPRRKMFPVVAAGRFARYLVIGVLAVLFGRRILNWADSAAVQWFVIGLTVLSIVGSAWSVVGWIRRSRTRAA